MMQAASAAPHTGGEQRVATGTAGSLDPGWVPTVAGATGLPPSPAVDRTHPSYTGSPAPHDVPPQTGTVVVRRGDCLWDIAARHLGRGAADAAIAEAWPRWYQTNRAVIGDDPDLLTPGTRLVVLEGLTR